MPFGHYSSIPWHILSCINIIKRQKLRFLKSHNTLVKATVFWFLSDINTTLTSCPSRQDLFFKGTWATFFGPFIYFRVSFAVSLCSPGSDKVIYSWRVWRRLHLFGVFEFWIFFFFMRRGFCTRDELSITELWGVRREELGVGNLSRIWCRAWKSHRTPCALQAVGSTWLKFIWSPWRCCIPPGCARVVSFRKEGERLEHSEEPMERVPVLPPAPNPAPKHPSEVCREDKWLQNWAVPPEDSLES